MIARGEVTGRYGSRMDVGKHSPLQIPREDQDACSKIESVLAS